MIKNAVIFSEEQRKETAYRTVNKNVLTLSRIEYRKIIEAAYREGRKDERRELEKKVNKNRDKGIRQKGKEEAIQIHAKETEENRQRVQTITARHDIEMLHVQSVFPFTIFTDTLSIDTTKVSIAKKQLFATEYITTIPLKDLSDVNVQTFLFLATITIRYMPQSASPGMNNPIVVKIPNLTRTDALQAKNILKGVLVAKAEDIDIAKLPPEEVVEVLQKFGQSSRIV
ncbi:MAG TPA: hypothetical protein VND99_04305 [Candidatus Acidoferrales bacterium]|nr:hypothetical protein [Candidatus Acidoferrales bacterium]